MTNPANTPSEDLKRMPGLFRRWELPGIFEANRDYHVEDAGMHADGTPLVALYTRENGEEADGRIGDGDHAPSDPKAIIPENLLPRDVVEALPLSLDFQMIGPERPASLPLFLPGGATAGDLRKAIVEIQQTLKADGQKFQALSQLYQELLAHGASADTGVFEMLGIIAIPENETPPCFGSVRQPARSTPISHPPKKAAGTVRKQPAEWPKKERNL